MMTPDTRRAVDHIERKLQDILERVARRLEGESPRSVWALQAALVRIIRSEAGVVHDPYGCDR